MNINVPNASVSIGDTVLKATSWKKIASIEDSFSITSTTSVKVKTISLDPSYYTDKKILLVHVRKKDGATDGYFYGSDAFYINHYAANGASSALAPTPICYRYSDSKYYANTGNYGIYGGLLTGDGTIIIYARYNSDISGIINSTYTIDVYALDPPDGVKLFD